MTPEEQKKLNERLAVAMAREPRQTWWHKGDVWLEEAANYATDPVAADELERWLHKEGWSILMSRDSNQHEDVPMLWHVTVGYDYTQIRESRTEALALAADKALKGKGCKR